MSVEQYCLGIYKSRYFWWNLTLADLRFKYRRSTLGVLWSIIQPLAMTLLLSFVMGQFFKMPMKYYAPYIFSGMIIWELMIGSVMTGCNALINSESYIRLFAHPMAIYPLRSSLSIFINFLYASVGLLAWVAVAMPENFGFKWLLILPAGVILWAWSWNLAIICAFCGLRFHDLSQFLVIIMQALWYVSPIFFPLQLFKDAKIEWLLQYNPIYHLLMLFRAPLLDGAMPSLYNWLWSLAVLGILSLISMTLIKVLEKKNIYYF